MTVLTKNYLADNRNPIYSAVTTAVKNGAKSEALAVNRVFKKLKIVFIAKQIFAPKKYKLYVKEKR